MKLRVKPAAPTSPVSVDKLADGVAKIPHPLAGARLPVPLKQSTPAPAAVTGGPASHPADNDTRKVKFVITAVSVATTVTQTTPGLDRKHYNDHSTIDDNVASFI